MAKKPRSLPKGVRQKPNGSYEGRISVKLPNGDTDRLSFCSTNLQEVINNMAEAQVQSRHAVRTKDTLGALLEGWLELIKPLPGEHNPPAPRVRFNTYAQRETAVRVHLRQSQVGQRLWNQRVERLQVDDLDAYFATLERNGVGGRARQVVYDVLKLALKRAARKNKTPFCIMDLVDRPSHKPKRQVPLTEAELTNLLCEIERKDRWIALYDLAIYYGLRQAELFALRWQNVDLKQGRIVISEALTKTEAGLRHTPTKTDNSEREIYLAPESVDLLVQHKKRQMNGASPASDLVFPSLTGAPLDRNTFRKKVHQPLVKAAGCPELTFHSMRKVAGTLHADSNVAGPVAKAVLGHADYRTTVNYYTRPTPEMMRRAATAVREHAKALRDKNGENLGEIKAG